MKRLSLTILFTTYLMVIPFFMSSCSSSDTAFKLDASKSAETTPTLAECQANQYLVEACIDILKADAQAKDTAQATTATALELKFDFEDCYTYTGEDTGEEALEGDELDCPATLEAVVTGYQACVDYSGDASLTACDELQDFVDEAVLKCDSNDESVSDEFCALLSA